MPRNWWPGLDGGAEAAELLGGAADEGAESLESAAAEELGGAAAGKTFAIKYLGG